MPRSNPETLRGPWASPEHDSTSSTDDEIKLIDLEPIGSSDSTEILKSSAETDGEKLKIERERGAATNLEVLAEQAANTATASEAMLEAISHDSTLSTNSSAEATPVDETTPATEATPDIVPAAPEAAMDPAEEARLNAEIDAALKKFNEFEERLQALMDKYSKIKDNPDIPKSEKMQILTDATKVNEEYQAFLKEKRVYLESVMGSLGGATSSAASSIDSGRGFEPVPRANSPRATVDTTGGIPIVHLEGVTEKITGADTSDIPELHIEPLDGGDSATGGASSPDSEPVAVPDDEPIPDTPERTGRLANIMRSIKNSSIGQWVSRNKREIKIAVLGALAGIGLTLGVGAIVNNYAASPNEGADPIEETDTGYQDETDIEAEDTTVDEDAGISSETEQTKGFHDGLNDPYMYTDANKPTAYAFSNFQALLESCNGDRDQAMEKLIRSDSNFAALLITRMNNQYRPGAFQNMNNYSEIETALEAQTLDEQETSIQEIMASLRASDGHADTYTGWAHNSGGRLIDANGYATISNLETVFSHTYEDNSPIYVYTFDDGSTVIVKDTCGNILVLDQEMETVTIYEGVGMAEEGEDTPDFTPAPAPPVQQTETSTPEEDSSDEDTGDEDTGDEDTGNEDTGDEDDNDDDKPDDDKPDDDKPDDDKPDDDKPDDEKPDDEKPDDEKPDDEKPDDEKPDEKPDNKPDTPTPDKPTPDTPTPDTPTPDTPTPDTPEPDTPPDTPDRPWGKEGTNADAGDQVRPDGDDIGRETEITEGENSKINEGDAGYTDDNHATPGASSESDGVNESGFADSGIAAPESSTEGTREEGGAEQDTSGVNGDENFERAQEEIEAGQQVDAVGNENQERAQENGGGGENNYTPEEEEALVNGGGIF